MKLWRVEHFWTYLSSLLGVIAEHSSNHAQNSFKIGTLKGSYILSILQILWKVDGGGGKESDIGL